MRRERTTTERSATRARRGALAGGVTLNFDPVSSWAPLSPAPREPVSRPCPRVDGAG